MIYVDSSVLLADLFAEQRSPPETLWLEDLASSRLLSYEVWNRINAYGLMMSHGDRAQGSLAPRQPDRDEPARFGESFGSFPVAVRTLDALHLATVEFLHGRGEVVELATYDSRLSAAAQALGISLTAL